MLELILTKLNSFTKHEMSIRSSADKGFPYSVDHTGASDLQFERVSSNHANRSGFFPHIGINA